jgi:hypothetical protein
MGWMDVLKVDLTLPNTSEAWLEKLENAAGAKSWADMLNLYKDSKDKKLRINNFKDFKTKVDKWVTSNQVIVYLLPTINKKYETYNEREEIIEIIENNWSEIREKLISFVSARSKGRVGGAAKTSSERANVLMRLFKDAEENIITKNHVDWGELSREFNKVYPRGSRNKINRFINRLSEKTSEVIFNNAPEDWPIKSYFKIRTLKDSEGAEYTKDLQDYSILEIDIDKAIEYIKKYSEPKKARKLRYNLKPMWIPKLTDPNKGLQFGGKEQKKRWTNKLFIELLETHDIDTEAYMARWLENIKRKFSIRLDKLQESYLKQSWNKKQDSSVNFDGWVDESFQGDSEEDYKNAVKRATNISVKDGGQMENWETWKQNAVKKITDSAGRVPKVFVDWVGAINKELNGSSSSPNSKGAVKEMEEIFGEEVMEDYKNTMSLKDFYGFSGMQSAPHPLNQEKNIAFFSLPNLNDTYSNTVGEIFNNQDEEKYEDLIELYDDYESAMSPMNFNDVFSKDSAVSKTGVNGSVNNFTTNTQKTIAYAVYDMILTNKTVQDTFIVETVQKYRGTDVNFLEAFRLLRKIDVSLNIGELMPSIKRLQSSLSNEDYKDLQFKLRNGEQILKEEIINIENGIKSLLLRVQPVVINLVKNKLLSIIQNQRYYQAEVNHNIMDKLIEDGFIRGQ